jgi:Plavaka transposase
MPLAQRRPRRLNRRLPLRFRDTLPVPLMPLPPPGATNTIQPMPTSASASTPVSDPVSPSTSTVVKKLINSISSSVRRVFRTQKNKFGLYRVYHTQSIPSHDPDDPFSVSNDCGDGTAPGPGVSENPFYPYPNEDSLRLGDWYWNQGAQKSKESFRELLDIVSTEGFCPEAVAKTNWQAVDKTLGQNQFDNQPDAGGWLDEDDGWRHTSVPISIPFHSRFPEPGPKTYHIHDFYHRSLTSIIRERISDASYASQFHYEPYELHWHPSHKEHGVRVYGELYTSEAFIEAHQQLQESPLEPGCDLPRVIAGLMLWSDSTHLTSFGQAKLWPLYLYFGNESKYRRCQPSCKLSCHAAYFQTVSITICELIV